jgi:hypothetical protein
VKRFSILALLFLASQAWGQFTTVSGTVTDPNAVAYSYGTITATLVTSASPTLNGFAYTPPTQPVGLSTAGSFLMQLADNTVLQPGGTKWTFQVCSALGTVLPAGGNGPICFTTAPLTISGASQDITGALVALAPAISAEPPSGASLWNRVGSVMYPRLDLAVDQQANLEPSVTYESGGCSLVSGTACWKMWFSCGWTTLNICYAEGMDPYNWVRQAGAVGGLTGNTYAHSVVFKSGSTYYFIAPTSAAFDLWTTSASVGPWGGRVTAVLSHGAGGQWDASAVYNPSVVTNGPLSGTWYMLYEGSGAAPCTNFCIGSATSTNNGTTWTKGGSNPFTNLIGFSGPDLHYVNGKWYAFVHTGTLPSDIWLTTSPDFVTWSVPTPVLYRQTIDEGAAATFSGTAQIADPFAIEAPCFAFNNGTQLAATANRCSYLFYDASQIQSTPNDFHIKLAIANLPLAQALALPQTMSPDAGNEAIQGIYDNQVGHIYGISPFYWMTRKATNTDLVGELAFSAATTSATYTFVGTYGIHPECSFGLQFNPGAGHVVWMSTLSTTTLQFSSDVAQTGAVSYRCDGRN